MSEIGERDELVADETLNRMTQSFVMKMVKKEIEAQSRL